MSNLSDVFQTLGQLVTSQPSKPFDQNISWTKLLEQQYRSNVFDFPISKMDDELHRTTRDLEDQQLSIHKPRLLEYLANGLAQRFEIYGAMTDIDKAVHYARQALQFAPDNRSFGRQCLSTLGDHLRRRHFGRELGGKFLEDALNDAENALFDIDEAVRLQSQAVESASESDPYRAVYMNNLARSLSDRSETVRHLTGNKIICMRKAVCHRLMPIKKRDSEKALRIFKEVLQMTSEDHTLRGTFLHDLGKHYGRMYDDGVGDDMLQEAVQFLRQAIEKTPVKSPNHGKYQYDLGCRLYWLFAKNRTPEDVPQFGEAMSCLQAAFNHESLGPTFRIGAAKAFVQFCITDDLMEEALEAASVGVSLMPMQALHLLDDSDKQSALGLFFDLPSTAAALALATGQDAMSALELLEKGRGARGKSLQDLRFDPHDLEEKYPSIGQRYTRLRKQLSSFITTDSSFIGEENEWKAIHQRYDTSMELDKLVEEIRGLDGFESFLALPTAAEARDSTNRGPIVIINVSTSRCDAILVQKHGVTAIHLPELNEDILYDKVEKQDVGSIQTLQWLWHAVACPVLDALGFTQPPHDDHWPHVWWIPTGILSRFPIHAAGYHGTFHTVLDRVMSSYSASVRAIIYTRRSRNPLPKLTKVLLVAMEETPGSVPLPFVRNEVKMLHEKFKSLSLEPIEPETRKESVLSHIRDCQIFHFAGHGHTNLDDPSDSQLRLDDWKQNPLTVNDLLQLDLHKTSPFLAYLSACGTGRVEEGKFMNESLHLISACQLAGFRHVIGTLWRVNDSLCVDMARVTYDGIKVGGMSDESVCQGLHNATRLLRDRWLTNLKLAEKRSTQGIPLRDALANAYDLMSYDDIGSGDARDVVGDDSDEENDRLSGTPHWVPYVHFGV
ncbi:CHAT domain-containing protein [Hypoxylon rubiginosum]|uniref:CHAT domain-containing protein n=1 Tax=Hypoxylon rubiginosum TaxID=110542 RepID=A0ACC0CKS6_9PEZI|nr:CHAT domain-containing protein [Hypoxylon rubiginosum]